MTEEYEKKIILELLEVCHGNKTEVARRLGLTVRNLYYKLDRYGIKWIDNIDRGLKIWGSNTDWVDYKT